MELTIEDAVDFYNGPEFQVVNFSVDQVNDVGAFLRVINTAFNLQIAIQRTKAALTIDPEALLATSISDFIGIRGTANRLLQLAVAEIDDAVDVLAGSPIGVLNPVSVDLAKKARRSLLDAIVQTDPQKRVEAMEAAAAGLGQANADLGQGMTFKLGQGNLLF